MAERADDGQESPVFFICRRKKMQGSGVMLLPENKEALMDKIVSRTFFASPKRGGSITGNLVEVIGEQKVERDGKIIEQYLYNIVGHTAENGLPFVALKANIVIF